MQASNMICCDNNNTITVNGNGQVTAVPDIAIIRLGAQTNGVNLEEIQTENAKIIQAVLQALEQYDLTDIRTFQYQINKVYEYEDGRQIDRGYSVRNILELRTNNMDQVGMIIDTAVANGANVVDLIDFEVSNKDAYYLEALKLALDDAYQKAYTIAESLRLSKEPVPVKIIENSTISIPPRPLLAREGAFATPIEPGSQQIEASVIVEFRY